MTDRIIFGAGHWTLPLILLAILLGSSCAWYYYQQIPHSLRIIRFLLPFLRGLAIVILLMMLTLPSIYWTTRIGESNRVCILFDGSESMHFTDPQMSERRKLLSLWVRDKIPKNLFPKEDIALWHELRMIIQLLQQELETSPNMKTLKPHISTACKIGLNVLERLKKEQDLPVSSLKPLSSTGYVFQEIWTEQPGSKISDIVGKGFSFQTPPHKTYKLEKLASSPNIADNYISRVRGYLIPPQTGTYQFYIYGDDETTFSLRIGADTNKIICHIPEWTSFEEWNKYPSQQSSPITLQRGEPILFELIQKEGVGDDHFGVGWILPDGRKDFPISGQYLASESNYNLFKTTENLYNEGMNQIHKLQHLFQQETSPVESWSILSQFLSLLEFLQLVMEESLDHHIKRLKQIKPYEIQQALSQFDKQPRYQRVLDYLVSSRQLTQEILPRQQTEFYLLYENEIQSLQGKWATIQDTLNSVGEVWSQSRGQLTNLGSFLNLNWKKGSQPTYLIVFSDGQHNQGDFPFHQIQRLGTQGIKVYSVVTGAYQPVRDLAISHVELPSIIRGNSKLKARCHLLDTVSPNQSVTLSVEINGHVVDQKPIQTTNQGQHTVDWEISLPLDTIKKGVIKMGKRPRDQDVIPLHITFSLTQLKEDIYPENNQISYDILWTSVRPKILLIDSHPRWIWRYLKNLCLRSNAWEVNPVVLKDQGDKGFVFPRGESYGCLPTSFEELKTYALIVIGDVHITCFKEEELKNILRYVEEVGGSLLWIVGNQHQWESFFTHPTYNILLPIERIGKNIWMDKDGFFRSTKETNLPVWLQISENQIKQLPNPRWFVQLCPSKVAETWLTYYYSSESSLPVLFTSYLGAGRIFIWTTPYTWYWQRMDGGSFHEQWWNNLFQSIIHRPFLLETPHISLDWETHQVKEGEQVRLRARLWNEQRQLVRNVQVQAILYKDEKVVSIFPLFEEKASGIYRGISPELTAGSYKLRLHVDNKPYGGEESTANLIIRKHKNLEYQSTNANLKWMKKISQQTRGNFLDEEELLLYKKWENLATGGQIISRHIALWQHPITFFILTLLITLDWILRKWFGLM